MKYYKDNQNNVYAYELDGSQDHLIGDKVAMTADEVEAHLNPPKTPEQLQAETNNEARDYLASTDWMMQRHADELLAGAIPTLTAQQLADLLAARQAARDSII